jgi:hypothetical protein
MKLELESIRNQHESESLARRSFIGGLRDWDEFGGLYTGPFLSDVLSFAIT